MYGRHSPIGSENVGFLVRNLYHSGNPTLVTCQPRLASRYSALLLGLLDGFADQQTTVSFLQLASRVFLVLVGLKLLGTLGILGAILTLPVIVAVAVGIQTELRAVFYYYYAFCILP